MKTGSLGTLSLLACTSALAAEPPSSPAGQPTAYACTVKTLEQGDDCYFDAADSPAAADPAQRAKENQQVARKLAEHACRSATKVGPGEPSSPAILKSCLLDFERVAADCDLEGKAPLLDGEGRFQPEGQECYEALGRVLSQARTHAATSPGCCACLAGTKCQVEANQCNQSLRQGRVPEAWRTCIAAACESECTPFAPPERKDFQQLDRMKEAVKRGMK